MQSTTDINLHRAAQYLAAFAINYLEKEPDDSHCNMAWDTEQKALVSRSLDDGMHLRLHVADLRLEWISKQSYTLSLSGRSHGEICVWLHHIALRCGLEEYDFYLHYSLDSGKIHPDLTYDDYDAKRAQVLINHRDLAQHACEQIRDQFSLETEIRIWPHHFDTGGYATLKNSDKNIGYGLAMPDKLINQHYLYAAGYYQGQPISVDSKPELNSGEWMDGQFTGAVRRLVGDEDKTAYAKFLHEALSTYL